MPRNIFFVGPMGSGKTTIGRQLAKALQRPFLDSDREIEARTGATIPLIFELEGEAGFRKRERAVIDDLTQRQGIILATGGGAILDSDNRAHLGARGYVVYLQAPIDRLLERTGRDTNRPLLQTADPRKTLEEMMNTRDPRYREIADLIIDTHGRSARSVVRKITNLVKKFNW